MPPNDVPHWCAVTNPSRPWMPRARWKIPPSLYSQLGTSPAVVAPLLRETSNLELNDPDLGPDAKEPCTPLVRPGSDLSPGESDLISVALARPIATHLSQPHTCGAQPHTWPSPPCTRTKALRNSGLQVSKGGGVGYLAGHALGRAVNPAISECARKGGAPEGDLRCL